MKLRYILTSVFATFIMFTAYTQSYNLEETTDDETNIVTITLPYAPDEVVNLWEDYVEDQLHLEFNKVDVEEDTIFYISNEVKEDKFRNTLYNINTKIIEQDNGNTTITTEWNKHDGSFLYDTDAPNELQNSKWVMKDFARSTYVEYYGKTLDNFKESRLDIVKEHNKLKRRNDKLRQRTMKLQDKITNYSNQTVVHQNEIKSNQNEIIRLRRQSIELAKKIDLLHHKINQIK